MKGWMGVVVAAGLTMVAARAQEARVAPGGGTAAASASSLLQPALTELGQAVGQTHLERWKGSNAIKDEEESNLISIRRDLDSTVGSLLAAADASPGSVASMLPLSRNLSALYDVLLRVEERGKGAAPVEQLATLEHARVSLDAARRAFDDQMQASAVQQEARLTQMQKALTAPPPPSPPPPAPAQTKKKGRSRPKPAASN